VSISPGVIATPMGRSELAGPFGDGMRDMVERSGCGRLGTPDDIAAAVEFLTSSAASYITGIDLLVDGGTVAALHFSRATGRLA
jgi:NAD(P)-dependent dehydrogenase (short-subunit alcohol dehydrogenase family)